MRDVTAVLLVAAGVLLLLLLAAWLFMTLMMGTVMGWWMMGMPWVWLTVLFVIGIALLVAGLARARRGTPA